MTLFQGLVAGWVLGFLSAGHCLGMCGPIAFLIGSGQAAGRRGVRRLTPFLWLGAGKALTYGWIGLVFGYAGHLLSRWSHWMGFAKALPLISGAGLIMFGFWVGGMFPKMHLRLAGFESRVADYLGSFKKPQSPAVLFCAGMLWGFLPCPMVLVPALGSAVSGGASGTEGALRGFVMMAGFGVGTVPVLASAGLGGGWVDRLRARWNPAWAGLCLAGLGVALVIFYWTQHSGSHGTCHIYAAA